jgi:hypothetical protein
MTIRVSAEVMPLRRLLGIAVILAVSFCGLARLGGLAASRQQPKEAGVAGPAPAVIEVAAKNMNSIHAKFMSRRERRYS